jgi:hypothetical protein
MHEGRIIFAQVMDWLPRYEFGKCVKRYQGNRYAKSLTCYKQFLMMAFAQLTYRESLRDIETGASYIMDRGYLDFARLHRIHGHGAFFVTRSKTNSQFQRRYSHPVKKRLGLRFDQTITLKGLYSRRGYSDILRRIGYTDPTTGKKLVFLTNNFSVPALTIALLYKSRWQIELFFKWIKQHLRIKAFYGTSENAVKTQIWIAVSVYVLVAIIRKQFRLHASLYTILQILSISLFENMPILQAFAQQHIEDRPSRKQLCLKGLLIGQ